MRFLRDVNHKGLRRYFLERRKRLELSREVQGPKYKSELDLAIEAKIREFARSLEYAMFNNVVEDPMCPIDQVYFIGLDTLIKSPNSKI